MQRFKNWIVSKFAAVRAINLRGIVKDRGVVGAVIGVAVFAALMYVNVIIGAIVGVCGWLFGVGSSGVEYVADSAGSASTGTVRIVAAIVVAVLLGVLARMKRWNGYTRATLSVVGAVAVVLLVAGFLGLPGSAPSGRPAQQNPELADFAAFTSLMNERQPNVAVTPSMYRDFLEKGAPADKDAVKAQRDKLLAAFGLRLEDNKLIAFSPTGDANLADFMAALP